MAMKDVYQEISDLNPADAVFAGEVKTRKTGNSISLTVPKTVKPRDGVQYTTIVFPDGTIVYKPNPQPEPEADKNPWLDGEYDHYDFKDALDHGMDYSDEDRTGREL